MAININTILQWFKAGKMPTEQQFSDSWKSFWHKDETIPQAKIENLESDLQGLEAHINDLEAHGGGSGTATTLQQMLDAGNNSLKAAWSDGSEGTMNFGEKIYNSNVRGFEFRSNGDGNFRPTDSTAGFTSSALGFVASASSANSSNYFSVGESSIYATSHNGDSSSEAKWELSSGQVSFSSAAGISGVTQDYNFTSRNTFNILGVTAEASKDLTEFSGARLVLDASTFDPQFNSCESLLIDPDQTLYEKYGTNEIRATLTFEENQLGYYFNYQGYYNDAYVWALYCDNEAIPSEPTAISVKFNIQDNPDVNFNVEEFNVFSPNALDRHIGSSFKIIPGMLTFGAGASSGGGNLQLTDNFNWSSSGTVHMGVNGSTFSLGNNQASLYAGSGGTISFDPSTGVSISGNAGGIGLYGNSKGVTIAGQGGPVKIETGSDNAGATYAQDYSAGFTDRSLVDKAYVDSVTGAISSEDFNWAGSGTISMTPRGGSFTLGGGKGSIQAGDGGQITFDPSSGVSISGNAGNVTINGSSGDIILNGGGQRGKTVVNNGGLEVVGGVFSARNMAYLPTIYPIAAMGNNGEYNSLIIQGSDGNAGLYLASGNGFNIYGSSGIFNVNINANFYNAVNLYGATTFQVPPIGASYFSVNDNKSFVQKKYVDDAIAAAGGTGWITPTLDAILNQSSTATDKTISLYETTSGLSFKTSLRPGTFDILSDQNSTTATKGVGFGYDETGGLNGYYLKMSNSNGTNGYLKKSYLTANRIWNLRDRSGDIAFSDEVTVKANSDAPVFTTSVTVPAPTANTTGTLWLTRNATTGIIETTLPGYALATGMTVGAASTAPVATANIVTNLSRVYGNLLTLRAYVAKTAAYTILSTDDTIDFTGATTVTATLLTAVGFTGKRFTIKNSGTGVITVATTSSQTIDGVTTFTLPSQYTSVTVQSDGANWKIMSVYGLQGEGTLSKSAAYTISAADYRNGEVTVFVDASTAAVNITLEASASMVGKTVNVIKTDSSANAVTLIGNGTTNINGANKLAVSAQYQVTTVKSNSTQYYATSK